MQSSTNQSERISILTGTITPNKYIENSQHFGQNSGILWILNLGSSILDPQSLGDHFKHSMFGSFDIITPPSPLYFFPAASGIRTFKDWFVKKVKSANMSFCNLSKLLQLDLLHLFLSHFCL